MLASIPAAIEVSTGLTDDACTRTSTSPGPGVGVDKSSRLAGCVPASLRVTAFMFACLLRVSVSSGGAAERLRDVVADLDLGLVAPFIEVVEPVGERVGVGLATAGLDEEVERDVGG